ncbi:MAG: zinc-dependent alcohol dehydrogenase family protein [Planctomycetota bacterium]
MRAALCERPGSGRLVLRERPSPPLARGQLRLRVLACGVCRTDLHLVDGELPFARPPVVPGHEVIGTVAEIGEGAAGFFPGQRVGVTWLGGACGACAFCAEGRENLCPDARFTGCTLDGGFAEECVAEAAFCLPLPEGLDGIDSAPLLCAGLIGHRAYRMAGAGSRIGLYGFGAAAHLLAQVAIADGKEVHAFTRAGDVAAQDLARSLGCASAGDSASPSPEPLDAAILFAPVGDLIPIALSSVRPAGRVICAGIHMSDVPSFPYRLLWGERALCSVANLTREDGRSFLEHAARIRPKAAVTRYPLAEAERALSDLREGRLVGAAVIVP